MSVFVALATWEPDLALLDRQLASLSAQTLPGWTGVVVDDASAPATRQAIAERVAREPRLRFVSEQARVGFYRNFARALALVPADARHVALCDQDDRWHPEKLARQVRALEAGGASLCYTDVRLVDATGAVLAGTFWRDRPHGRTFREVLYNNVVTGATALVRRELLALALPFPDDPGGAFHDHWLALCALATGGAVYLDDALVDYTQHDGNALGAQGHAHAGGLARAVARIAGDLLADPRGVGRRLDALAAHAARSDARLRAFADALRRRLPALSPSAAAALRPFSHAGILGRALDLAGPTLVATLLARQETNLEPLKLPIGHLWAALRRAR